MASGNTLLIFDCTAASFPAATFATFDARSQSQLARALGVKKSCMEAWCSSRNRVPPGVVPQFAAALGIEGDPARLAAFWTAAGWPELAAVMTRRMRRTRSAA